MENKMKKSESPLILGIISLAAWFIPIIGAPVSITGIVISAKKIKSENTKSSKIGLALNIIGLIFTIANAIFSYYLISKKLK